MVTVHARELRLVQYPSLTWITPHMLYPILSRLTAFESVTCLSLHSFSLRPFNEEDILAIFGRFFPTVRELNLEEPRATVGDLFRFLCRFRVLDNLSISDPEWEPGNTSPATGVGAVPPLRGTLYFLRLHADSENFVNLLASMPIAFKDILFANCRLPSKPVNRLLRRLSSSLKSFCASAWFDGGSRLVHIPLISND